MTTIQLDPATLAQRYKLLCRALQATPAADDPQPALTTVGRLDDLIHRELLELARMGSPDDFADIYLGFDRELARFREFCADPRLAEKTVVAFGGPFSAGKSSLINALIGKKLLVVEVDPTTALPAYVLAGEADAVHALNLHHLRVPLTDEEFASLTHDEIHRYGSQVARALSAAFVTRRDFPWANLAFIDTPGYTGRATAGDRTDADLAAAQLAGAHAIVWVASVKQGNLSEEDLAFLARLDPNIPRIVVASHADQLTDSDRAAVTERMRDTLAARNLPVLGVYAVSNRPRYAELLAPLRDQLDAWNQTPRQQRFAHRFKALFTRYQRGLEREAAATRWQLHRINRIATLADGDLVADASQLKTVMDERLGALKTVETRLRELSDRFFGELKRAGDSLSIYMPEPDEVDLLEPQRSNLLEQLIALREIKCQPESDFSQTLRPLVHYDGVKLKVVNEPPFLQLREIMLDRAPGKDDHLRQHFALLLAAALASQPAISKNQTRLFYLLLDSLNLGDIRATLFEKTRELSPENLIEIARIIRADYFGYNLLLDALVLLSFDFPLSNEVEQLVGELTTLLGLGNANLSKVVKNTLSIKALMNDSFSEPLRTAENYASLDNKFWRSVVLHSISAVTERFHEMAKEGSLDAQFCVGEIYYHGACVPKNNAKACEWYLKAAKRGHKQSFTMLQNLANEGISVAQFTVGQMYERGYGVTAHISNAIIYYELAEKNGYPLAHESLKIARDTEQRKIERDERERQEELKQIERKSQEMREEWDRLRASFKETFRDAREQFRRMR